MLKLKTNEEQDKAMPIEWIFSLSLYVCILFQMNQSDINANVSEGVHFFYSVDVDAEKFFVTKPLRLHASS